MRLNIFYSGVSFFLAVILSFVLSLFSVLSFVTPETLKAVCSFQAAISLPFYFFFVRDAIF